jgi:hypothetical protein
VRRENGRGTVFIGGLQVPREEAVGVDLQLRTRPPGVRPPGVGRQRRERPQRPERVDEARQSQQRGLSRQVRRRQRPRTGRRPRTLRQEPRLLMEISIIMTYTHILLQHVYRKIDIYRFIRR